MGTWGARIHQNDVGDDIRNEYLSKLKSGKSDEVALNEILMDYENEIQDADDIYDVYFSLADIMWKKGRLTEEIKNKAIALIELEEQSDRWESEKLRKARHKSLMKLQEELLSEMPPRKRIPIHKPYIIGWEATDVYSFQIKNPPEGYGEYKDWYVLLYIDNLRRLERSQR